jgi:hypothetical protein
MACDVEGYCHAEGDATDCTPTPDAPPAAPTCGGPCDSPPTSCASECEALAYEPTGDCVDGECVYQPVVAYTCPYGCNTATGACYQPPDVCDEQICDHPTACGGACLAGSGCIVELELLINGDCVTTSCPADAPHPVGCNIVMQGDDSRGCVAAEPTGSVVFFKEGNKCDAGRVTGTLLCSSTPGDRLDAVNCPINKPNKYYPLDGSGCPD